MATQSPEFLGVPEQVELPFFDPVEHAIHQSIDYLILLLNQRRFYLVARLRDKRDEIRANQAAREQIDRQLVESRALLEGQMTHNVLHSMQERIVNELEAKRAEIHATRAQNLSYNCDTHEIEERINRLGEIIQTNIIPDQPDIPTPTPTTTPTPQIQIQIPSVPNYAAFHQPIVAVGNYGSSPGEFKRPLGLAVDPKSEYIYIVDNNNRRIQIFTQTGEYLNELTSVHLEKPWGILIHEDHVYVTECRYNTILQFQLPYLTLVKRVGKEGSGKEDFNRPSQLAISPDQHLYIADQRNHRIQVMTTDLTFKNSLCHLKMSHPIDVKFSKEELFVLSHDNPCIQVFSLSGKKIRSLLTKGKGLQIQKAWFFCLDGCNNIIISDLVEYIIKVFSPQGNLIHTIHQEGHEFHGIEIFKNKIISVSRKMDLLENLSPAEIVMVQSFFKESRIALPDRSVPALQILKLLYDITSSCCLHGNNVPSIIHILKQRVLIHVYPPLHKHLFSFKNWPWSEELISAVEKAKLEKLSNSLKEVSRGIFMVEILPVEFCIQLLEEITNYESWCQGNQLSIHRPNSMNSYGAILDEFGFNPVLQELTKFITPLFKLLYGEEMGDVDSHHGFVVAYELGKDVNLGFHVDDAQVTMNLCLGSEFTGGNLWFSGVRCPIHINTSNTEDEYYTYSHMPGTGLIHMGKHRHGAKDITAGKRSNLIVWFRSEKERKKEVTYYQDKTCPSWCWYEKTNK